MILGLHMASLDIPQEDPIRASGIEDFDRHTTLELLPIHDEVLLLWGRVRVHCICRQRSHVNGIRLETQI